MEEFKKNLDASLQEAENMSGQQFSSVHVVTSGTTIQAKQNQGMIAVPGEEITSDDISRVLDMAQSGLQLQNQSVLKIIPEFFSVDLEPHVKSPIGMSANKLEVNANIFSIADNVLSNVKKGFSDIGLEVQDAYPSLLSAPEAVLTRRQKELGVVCIDIGSSTTGVTVYEEGILRYASIIPVGGELVTSDIALGARISVDIAEKLKVDYGDLAFASDESARDEEIKLSRYDKREDTTLSKKFLSEILQARYQEICKYINQELKRIGKDGMLPEGAVFVGGGAKMKNLLTLAKQELRLPCSIGFPEDQDFVSGTSISDPIFASCVGTLMLVDKYGTSSK